MNRPARALATMALGSSLLAASPAGAAAPPGTELALPGDTVVTIVRVRKPWYAPRFYLRSRFEQSIPQYAAIPGLLHKMYTLTDDGGLGGIYLWRSRADAQAWFSPQWHERVRTTYGEAGIVTFFQVTAAQDYRTPAEQAATQPDLKAVATLTAGVSATRAAGALPGLWRRYALRTAGGEAAELLLWDGTDSARAAIADARRFDVPVMWSRPAAAGVQ